MIIPKFQTVCEMQNLKKKHKLTSNDQISKRVGLSKIQKRSSEVTRKSSVNDVAIPLVC